jgi:hypothetical protein
MMDEKGNLPENWHRGYVKQKDGTVNKLVELSMEEVEFMKRAYERLHGSYRSEERLIGELTVFGQWALQFKKYLPTLLKENWRRSQKSPYVGFYKQVDMPELTLQDGKVIKPNDVNVYEWEEILTQGRINIMLLHSLEFLKARKWLPKTWRGDHDKSYVWENLSSDQKVSIINGWTTFLMLLVAPALIAWGADDDDKNKYWYRRLMRLIEDLSLGFKPQDLIRPIATNPIPVLDKMLEITDAFGVFAFEGM